MYPWAVAEALAACSPGRALAWDAGCGSGQLSVVLAEAFDQVVATDASAAQIAEAVPHPRVRYAVAPAEVSGLPDGTVDCAVAAQAAHWFISTPTTARCAGWRARAGWWRWSRTR